jgi:hypothetical protein
MDGSIGTSGEIQEQTVQRCRDIGRDTGADSAEMEGDVGTSGEIRDQTVQRWRDGGLEGQQER